MPRISPFHGLVFDPALSGPLSRVTAPPYDVINERKRRDHLGGSPFSVVHLDLGEGSQDPDHPESRYARAAKLLTDWEARGVLTRSPDPRYYAYEMAVVATPSGADADGTAREPRIVRGLMCALDLEPWGGTIVPHERTMAAPIVDRLQLLRATRTHVSAVYGTIEGPAERLSERLRSVAGSPTPWAVEDDEGVRHRMWSLAGTDEIASSLAGHRLLIADGHHRYATALRYRDERRTASGAGPWDRVLAFIVDSASEQLTVLPFHRLQLGGAVARPGSMGTGAVRREGLEAALAACSDEDAVVAIVRRGRDGSMRYDSVALAAGPPAVRALHEQVLDRLDPHGSIRFVADARVADERVRSGEAVGAYLLPPTTPDRIRAVIERGERLPEKSTYFWPKPRTGMVMMPLDPMPAHLAAPAS